MALRSDEPLAKIIAKIKPRRIERDDRKLKTLEFWEIWNNFSRSYPLYPGFKNER